MWTFFSDTTEVKCAFCGFSFTYGLAQGFPPYRLKDLTRVDRMVSAMVIVCELGELYVVCSFGEQIVNGEWEFSELYEI